MVKNTTLFTLFLPSSSEHNLFLGPWQALRQHAIDDSIPVISLENALFLKQLLSQHRPKHMLEIGSAVGVSGAWIGHVLNSWDGHLDTLDISVPNHRDTQKNLTQLGIGNVCAYCADALEWLGASINTLYDCVFIDAHKLQSQRFYTACLRHLKQDGLIIIDDAWKFRHKMQGLYHYLATTNTPYSLHFVDTEDATLVIYPKNVSKQSSCE
jgi:predicted O-methyltransferase YrrM